MNIRYCIDLTDEERAELSNLLSAGKSAVRRLKRAQILLAADRGPAMWRSNERSAQAARRSIAPNAALWRKASRLLSAKTRAPVPSASLPARKRRF